MSTVLIADTDPYALDHLPQILSKQLPHVEVAICTSTEDLTRNCNLSTYDTIAISPSHLQQFLSLKHRANRNLLTPLLVTASLEDRELASAYLKRDAFDVIVKPFIAPEAAQTVRLALWQRALLKLLASHERASERFREHMEAFPRALKAQEEFATTLAVYERTFRAITSSLRHLLTREEEDCLFHIAGVVGHVTRRRALDRLLHMYEDGPTH